MVYIAIDIGSTYIKSSLLDPHSGEILARTRASVAQRIQQSSSLRFEVDMADMLEAVRGILSGYMTSRSDVAGIVFSTQMHGFVYSEPDEPQDKYISWQDARCLETDPQSGECVLDMLKRRISVEEMRPTGVYLKPALGMCNLYALIRERGGCVQRGAKLYTLGSYLIEKLTGNNVCHMTNAAPIGLADIEHGCWYRPLIEKLGFENIELPRLTTKMEVCGWYCAHGQRVAVYPDVGDVQASIYGSGAVEGDVTVNMATAGQVVMLHRTASIGCGDPRYYEIRPYFDGLYCHTISRMPSGRNMEVLVELVRDIGKRVYGQALTTAEVWQRLDGCGAAEDAQGLTVDTSFYEMPERLADGAICHVNRANLTLENLFSAAYADLGSVYAHYIRLMEEAVGQKAARMVFCGGAVRKNPMIQRTLVRAVGLCGALSASEDEVHEGMMKLVRGIERQRLEKEDIA